MPNFPLLAVHGAVEPERVVRFAWCRASDARSCNRSANEPAFPRDFLERPPAYVQ